MAPISTRFRQERSEAPYATSPNSEVRRATVTARPPPVLHPLDTVLQAEPRSAPRPISLDGYRAQQNRKQRPSAEQERRVLEPLTKSRRRGQQVKLRQQKGELLRLTGVSQCLAGGENAFLQSSASPTEATSEEAAE